MARGANKPDANATGSVRIAVGELAKAMKHAAGVVESRNTIPILSNVLLRAEGDTIELAAAIRRGDRAEAELQLDRLSEALGPKAVERVQIGRFSPRAKGAA